jgi:hypothetical protein
MPPETAENFQLQFGSPAIDAGVHVYLTQDYAGKPMVNTPDIGAHEFRSERD